MEVAVDNVIEESEGKNDSAIDDPSNNINSNMNDDNAAYESDYSLRIPISNVRFRGSQLHVIDTDHDQLILKQQLGNDEKKHNKTTLVKRLSPITYAQRAIRIGYSLITIIFVGFLFVFCCEVLLFLGIALPVSANEAWSIPQLHLFSHFTEYSCIIIWVEFSHDYGMCVCYRCTQRRGIVQINCYGDYISDVSGV